MQANFDLVSNAEVRTPQVGLRQIPLLELPATNLSAMVAQRHSPKHLNLLAPSTFSMTRCDQPIRFVTDFWSELILARLLQSSWGVDMRGGTTNNRAIKKGA